MRSVPPPGGESDPHTGVFRSSFWPMRSLAAAGSCSSQWPSTYIDYSYECRDILPPPPMRALPSGCTPHLSLPYPEKLLCRKRLRMLPPGCIPQVIATTNCKESQLFLPCSHTVPADPGRPLESPSRCSFPNRVLPSPPILRCSRCLLPPSSCHRHLPAASFGVSSLARPPLLDPCPLHDHPSRQSFPFFPECYHSYGKF